jgi:hypothetical protein
LHSLSQYLPSPFEEGSLDEDKVKLASSIRQFFYQSVMVEFFENGRSQDLSINDAVKCSITDLDQIFPTIRLIDWNQFSTQAVINRVTVLCALLREAPINKKQAIVKYISTSMAYLIGCETSDEIIETWQDINETVCEDVCGDNKKAMAWIIRILDAFVVHMGAFDDSSIFDDQAVAEAICYGLRETLIFIQAIPFEFISLSQDVQLADTVCQLDYYLNLQGDFKTEQEQVNLLFKTIVNVLLIFFSLIRLPSVYSLCWICHENSRPKSLPTFSIDSRLGSLKIMSCNTKLDINNKQLHSISYWPQLIIYILLYTTNDVFFEHGIQTPTRNTLIYVLKFGINLRSSALSKTGICFFFLFWLRVFVYQNYMRFRQKSEVNTTPPPSLPSSSWRPATVP